VVARFAYALILAVVVLVAAGITSSARASGPDDYYGNYRISQDHAIGIDRFVADSGETWMLFSDYQSGVVRRLFAASQDTFEMGPGFDKQSPTELRVRFARNAKGEVSGVSLQPTKDEARTFAARVPLSQEEVTITDEQVKLSGTLLVPATKGPHPAIILLHGSGPPTRYSFGPYPHFFTSLGLAVLIYDKRGTGASTGGTRLDTTTIDVAQLPEYYPDGLKADAVAAFRFLQSRKDINPKKIGLWGSSEGGMLATQVAAQDKDVAFAINSAGFMGPLWQTTYYQFGSTWRGSGVSPDQVDEALAFTMLWLDVARTGDDHELFSHEREKAESDKKPWVFWSSNDFRSLEQMRWDWSHVLSFSPLPELTKVTCPVLGLWGRLDEETDAVDAERNMRSALIAGGNKDFALRIFPNANHPLQEMPSRSRMAPGVFETLRAWLLQRVQTPSGKGETAAAKKSLN
jgi:pimeloyl-ACP methyl ester carboxylesterase